MSVLVVAVLFGLGFAYLATQNTMGATVNFWQYRWENVPVYLIALGSLLGGLIISWILSMVDNLANALSMRGKDQKINQSERVLGELQDKIHKLEVENANLKGTTRGEVVEVVEKRQLAEESHHPRLSFMDRLKTRLSV